MVHGDLFRLLAACARLIAATAHGGCLARLTAALCVGLAVLFGLEAVLAVVETEPMVVAAARFDGVTLFWPPTFSWLICRYLRQARLGQAILRMWWAR